MVDHKKLTKLASFFPEGKPLYAVGGYVRDRLLGMECHDVDVCAELTVDEVKQALKHTDFVVSDKNLRVGTVVISGRGLSIEYTTFRTDSYPDGSGTHTPSEVTFTDDIKVDALRRDFGANAIYLDIVKDEIVDPLGRVDDVKNRIIKTADDPDRVFSADGHRILRMVRFACELGFEIDKDTFASAKKYASQVKDLTVERIYQELDRIFVADTRHPELNLTDAHHRGLKLLDELGLMEELFPAVNALKGLEQNPKYHLYDAYEHTLEAFKASKPNVRWATLLHDIGKRPCQDKYGNTYVHASVGADMTKDILAYYKMPKQKAKRVYDLVFNHMVNINRNMSKAKLDWFVAEHAGIASDLADLIDADTYGAMGAYPEENFVRETLNQLIEENAPLSVKDLPVTGRDLIDMGVEDRDRGMMLYELWRECIMNPALRTREKALQYVAKRSGK